MKALLDLLRSQQDPAQAGRSRSSSPQQYRTQPPSEYVPAGRPSYTPDPPRSPPKPQPEPEADLSEEAQVQTASASASPPAERPDLSKLSFGQALSHVAKLAQDAAFVSELRQLKAAQNALEDELADKRQRLIRAMLARQAAAAAQSSKPDASPSPSAGKVGSGQDAQLNAESRIKLASFDRAILKKWDELQCTQQGKLEALGVPCFFVTSRQQDIRKQEQVMRLLEDILNEEPTEQNSAL